MIVLAATVAVLLLALLAAAIAGAVLYWRLIAGPGQLPARKRANMGLELAEDKPEAEDDEEWDMDFDSALVKALKFLQVGSAPTLCIRCTMLLLTSLHQKSVLIWEYARIYITNIAGSI